MPRYTTKPIEETPLPVRLSTTDGRAILDVQCDGHWIEVLSLDLHGEVQVAEHGRHVSAKLLQAGMKMCGSPASGIEGSQRVEVRVGSRRLIMHPKVEMR